MGIFKKNEFGDKNYKMKEEYNANNLIIAQLRRISSIYTLGGPMVETTKQKYIFESMQIGTKTRYREIFTGFITDNFDETKEDGFDCKYFDLPYVCELEKFTDYFPETKGNNVPKLSLIWAQNDINYSKEKESAKIIKK